MEILFIGTLWLIELFSQQRRLENSRVKEKS
jgi:hypothetical protein